MISAFRVFPASSVRGMNDIDSIIQGYPMTCRNIGKQGETRTIITYNL